MRDRCDMKEEIVGKHFTTNNSGVCVVTKYVNCEEVHIKFLDTGFERVTHMSALRTGSVKDKTKSNKRKYEYGDKLLTLCDVKDYFKVVDGEVVWSSSKGCNRAGTPILNKRKIVSFNGNTYSFEDLRSLVLGEVFHIVPIFKPKPEGYDIWNSMQKRCKDAGYPMSETFAKYKTWIAWAKDQKGFKEVDKFNRPFRLDSDMFSNGEKTYSEDTCVFIPEHLNQIYKTSYKDKKELGVDFRKGSYRARINMFNKQVIIGTYKREEDAIAAYRAKRSEYVGLLLNIHRDQLEDKTIKFIEDDIKNDMFI